MIRIKFLINNQFLVFVLSFVSMFSLSAQDASIEGQIKQKDSLYAISGVFVYLEGTDKNAITNGTGNYVIDGIEPGTYNLRVYSYGYETKIEKINLSVNERLTKNFTINELAFDLPEIVVRSTTLTGGELGVKEIDGSASYISSKELEKFNYTDINRTLRAIPGVNIQEEDGFGLFPNIGLRGSGVERSSKVTIMEDGILMAPAPYAASAAYYSPTMGRMSGVEVVKGSSQIQHGPYTTGGAINFISTPIPNKLSGQLKFIQGSFGTSIVHAHFGNSHKYFGYMVETFQNTSDGFKNLDNNGNTGFNKADYTAKLRFNTSKDAKVYQSITFKLANTSMLANETYLGLTRSDFETDPLRRYAGSMADNINTNQTQYSATYLIQATENISFTATAYHNDFARNWYKVNDVFNADGDKISISDLLSNPETDGYGSALGYLRGEDSPDDVFNVRANNRVYYSQGFQGVLNYKFKTKEIKHSVDLGFRIHRDEMDRFQWEDGYKMLDGTMMQTSVGVPGTQDNRIETGEAVAGYLQYKLSYKKLALKPGLRYENVVLSQINYGKNNVDRDPGDENISERQNQTDVFVPGLSLDYKFTDNLRSFVGVHKGFAPPGSNEGSKAESSVNYELGTRYYSNGLSGSLVLFYNDYSNLQGSDLAATGGLGTTDLFNAGEAITYGLEIEGVYNVLKDNNRFNVPIRFNYTFIDAEFLESFDSEFEDWGTVNKGDKIPYIAQNQFGLGISFESALFDLNINARYMDPMRVQAGTGSIDPVERVDGFFIMDLSASYAIHNKIRVFSSVMNVLDERYNLAVRPSGFRPGLPRMFNIGIKASF